MMIEITVADSDLNFADLYTHMNPLMAGAELIQHSKARLVFEGGSGRFILSGTGLVWLDGALQDGAVDALTLRHQNVDLVSFDNLQTSGVELWAAMQAEQSGSDPAALTRLLVRHCWTYRGSDGVDYFPETTIAPFGTLNPSGNDKVFLNGGDDVFFTGSAQDTVLGGTGNDQVAGGSGNDQLFGGIGNDSLYGGRDDDRLDGGWGANLLSGGAGDDTLFGGPAADRLHGGVGADVFVFASPSGQHVITDYTPGVDHLQITSVDPVTVQDLGADTVVHFGFGAVLLKGVTVDQLTLTDFL